MTAPLLKTDPKYGHFPWWPEDGDAWVHPADAALARTLIPSSRVFRREGMEGEYLVMRYGVVVLRVRRTMWQEVESEGLEIGDWVEVLALGMQNEARTGVVREMLWDDRARAMRYQITESGGKAIDQLYAREELQLVVPTK